MTRRNKARVALTVLLLVAVWPLAHRALVARYGVSPWKLYGFAMYCMPSFESELLYLATPKGKEDRTPHPTRFPIEFEGAAEALESYQAMEFGLGRLASTDGLAELLFEANPAVVRLYIRRAIGRFDVEAATPAFDYDTTVYDRP